MRLEAGMVDPGLGEYSTAETLKGGEVAFQIIGSQGKVGQPTLIHGTEMGLRMLARLREMQEFEPHPVSFKIERLQFNAFDPQETSGLPAFHAKRV